MTKSKWIIAVAVTVFLFVWLYVIVLDLFANHKIVFN